ncbi:MAG TPA: DNA adenine methylase [Gallicola sp.]|nr:DNA adenine methylase [Gallicola sp.]
MDIKYIKSPINYSGGKYRLLKQIMPLFPSNIDTFVDLFCGAGTVGINANANKIIFNDYIHYLPELFNLWKNKSLEEINQYIDKTIEENNLSPTSKDSFIEFRKKYNTTKNIEDLFILICYSFNYQMRFNNSHQYNSSFGYEASTMNDNIRNNINLFVNAIHNKDVTFLSKDFREVDLSSLTKNDFVYCDPPYLISGAVYQDGKRGFKGWSPQDDIDLYGLLDNLNSEGIRFALSNMIHSKNRSNDYLIEWSKKYNVNYLRANYNSNYQRDMTGKDVEVLITNY